MDKSIESYKWDKKNEIINNFKTELEQVEVTLPVQGTDYLFKTRNDYDAYKEVLINIQQDDVATDTIQSFNGTMLELTYSELKPIVNAMYLEGKQLWGKKESLLSQLENASTVEAVLAIVW